MGAGALTICHNKAAVKVKEDMLKMVQIPILKPRGTVNKQARVFGKSLSELQEQGLLKDGLPLVVRRMVEHLRTHGVTQEGLFRVNGNVRAVELLRQRLDREDVMEDMEELEQEADVSAVASLLKLYLRELPQALITPSVQQALIHHYQDCGESGSCSDVANLLKRLPEVHLSLLRYLCYFLTQVESNHKENRMTAHNLATVFGPSVFHVAASFEAMKDQTTCNKIMVKLIQNYSSIFETEVDFENYLEDFPNLIIVKEAQSTEVETRQLWSRPDSITPQPAPRMKHGTITSTTNSQSQEQLNTDAPKPRSRKAKVRKSPRSDTAGDQVLPKSERSAGEPNVRPLSRPVIRSPERSEAELKLRLCCHQRKAPHPYSADTSSSNSMGSVRRNDSLED